MEGGYPLQMGSSLSSGFKRFLGFVEWARPLVFAFLVPHSQRWVRGEALRGELCQMERMDLSVSSTVLVCEGRLCSTGPFGHFLHKKKKHHRGLERLGRFFEKAASALLRSPLILPTSTLVYHNLHANRLTQWKMIIQLARSWQWSHKSLSSRGKIPHQTQITVHCPSYILASLLDALFIYLSDYLKKTQIIFSGQL